jgi:hypothetical protein
MNGPTLPADGACTLGYCGLRSASEDDCDPGRFKGIVVRGSHGRFHRIGVSLILMCGLLKRGERQPYRILRLTSSVAVSKTRIPSSSGASCPARIPSRVQAALLPPLTKVSLGPAELHISTGLPYCFAMVA